ncbi:hypothetical protein AVEN_40432-1 [Araneus ventricosus]|uniref:Uncharacterized protein n=1 Tax=Araneus ventricosus TaxID=182803 RepID=A0A4Y2TK41_ARAVE|nr:hypothetical protein AVEN_40432-1 [Araneus ventricosus]
MTRTTPELAHPFPNFHATPTGGRLATTYDLACNRSIYGGSSVELGFEPGCLRPQSTDLATMPQRPLLPIENVLCSSVLLILSKIEGGGWANDH